MIGRITAVAIVAVCFTLTPASAQENDHPQEPSIKEMRGKLSGKVPRFTGAKRVPDLAGRRPDYSKIVKDVDSAEAAAEARVAILSDEEYELLATRRAAAMARGGADFGQITREDYPAIASATARDVDRDVESTDDDSGWGVFGILLGLLGSMVAAIWFFRRS